MLRSVLLHVDGDDRRTLRIPVLVDLAARHAARVRGLMIVDTRRVAAAAADCLSAVHAADESERLQQQERQQASALTELTRECLRTGVDFDVRRLRGDPLELLPPEARFHDLVVTSCPLRSESGYDVGTIRTLAELGLRSAQPLLVLRTTGGELRRVLLIYDGTPAAERAIRSFLSLELFADSEVRLLAVGHTDDEARRRLAEIAEFVRPLREHVEFGRTAGPLRRVVATYAEKWDADLVVLGIPRRDGLLGRLSRDSIADVLCETAAAVFMSG